MFEKYDNVDAMFDNIDAMFYEIKSKIIEEVEASQKATIEQLTEENKNLKSINNKLLKAAKKADKEQDNFELFSYLVYRFKQKIKYMDNPERDRAVYEFLDVFFTKDFMEDTYECPLWLGCVVQYYSNRETVVKVLKMLDIDIPVNIDSFRLPLDWTEEELDIVFDTMDKHIVCNNALFKDNLRFWKLNALDSVDNVCHCGTYSEIPWQFLLRNPNLLKDKYLVEMGKMAWDRAYTSGWRTLFKITDYQTLTEEQLKTIIGNINPYHTIKSEERFEKVYSFLLDHLEFIEEPALLDSIYKAYSNSYDFKYKNCLLKMPYKYILQYMKDQRCLGWVQKNKENFTNEQIRELTLAAMGD